MSDAVIRIKPHHYIHVLDNNTNVTRVEIGPMTFTRQDHETVVCAPEGMVMVPPRNFCVIANPVIRQEGKVVFDAFGQAKLRHGDEEIRFQQDPFALYPGEKLVGKVQTLQVVPPNSALHLRALRDFVGETEGKKIAGDEWLSGPGTYIPRIEVTIVGVVKAIIIKPNEAVRLRARKEFTDAKTKEVHKAGDEWLVRDAGAFLPDVNEEVIETVRAVVLTDKKALHLQALKTFTDVFKVVRKAGEEWLITLEDAETHIPDVYEHVVGEVKLITLSSREYCVVIDPFIEGKIRLGQRQLRRGENSFFLQPGERLESGIQKVDVLGAEEALLLRAREAFKDEDGDIQRASGDRWMIYGPRDYVPPVQVEVLARRTTTPLDENEGIYVRDTSSGQIREVIGVSYMLKPNEELWQKELSEEVEDLLARDVSRDRAEKDIKVKTVRDKTRVVTYRTPHNSAIQIYDYKAKTARVVFGPDLVMLKPDEHFSVLSLSGDCPKRPNAHQAISLLLGPDFMTDLVVVETSDHARLSLHVAYNWYFRVNKDDPKEAAKIFQVPDFIGDACKAIASRVRGAVAAHSFDAFHRNSSTLIRQAVFGVEADGVTPKEELEFSSNNLIISGVDIQSVEPVDQKTRDALQKSHQMSIEIITKSQEATARHESERREQVSRGELERQKILDEAEAEKANKELLTLRAKSAAVESTGQATAEAKARAEAAQIEAEAAVKQAEKQAEAMNIKAKSELAQLKARQEAEISHKKALFELEVTKQKEMADIEGNKFAEIVDAIGADTIKSMAQAGPEMQAKLLKSLGLQGYLITDGQNPINLFNTANGLVGGANNNGQAKPVVEDF